MGENGNQKPIAADLYFFSVCKGWNLAVPSQSIDYIAHHSMAPVYRQIVYLQNVKY